MTITSSQGVTQLLERWGEGDQDALERLPPLVYDELHRLAEAYLRRERLDHTLQPNGNKWLSIFSTSFPQRHLLRTSVLHFKY